MLVFLIGMPGAGKTTLGKALATELGFGFADLDAEIEKAEGEPIPVIFSEKGEVYFRNAEARELRKFGNRQKTVIATGGGTPCFHGNLLWLNANGLTFYLQVPVEVLVERLKNQINRPLLAGKTQTLWQTLHETLTTRKEYYEQAAVIVAAANPNPKDLAQLVRENLLNT